MGYYINLSSHSWLRLYQLSSVTISKLIAKFGDISQIENVIYHLRDQLDMPHGKLTWECIKILRVFVI